MTGEDVGPDIFLSYKKEDVDRVGFLVEALELQGWSVWWDPEIRAGEQWSPAIEAAITAARCVVVVWSERSVSSPWVHKEARRGESEEVLMPVMLDKVAPPFEFEHLQGANLVGWTGGTKHPRFLELVRQIEALLGKEARAERESAGRLARRIVRYRAHVAAAVLAFLTLGGTGWLLSRPVAVARDVRLTDVVSNGVRMTLDRPEAGQSTGAGNGMVTATTRMALTEVTIGVDEGTIMIPSATGTDGTASPAIETDMDIVRLGPPGPAGALELAPLELAAGSEFAVARSPGGRGFLITLRTAEEGVANQELELRAVGSVDILVPGAVEGTLDFGAPGKGVVLRSGGSEVELEMVPLAESEAFAPQNVPVSRLELSSVDEVVELGSSRATRISSTTSGTLTVAGVERVLGPSEAVRFDTFEGVVGRLGFESGDIRFSAAGRRVTGLEVGSANEYTSLMPPRWRQLDDGWRALVAVGAVLWLAGLFLLIPRFWRAPR